MVTKVPIGGSATLPRRSSTFGYWRGYSNQCHGGGPAWAPSATNCFLVTARHVLGLSKGKRSGEWVMGVFSAPLESRREGKYAQPYRALH